MDEPKTTNAAPARSDRPRAEEPPRSSPPIPLAEIEAAIRSVRFGTVQIIIQDGYVIQIDKTEKVRLR